VGILRRCPPRRHPSYRPRSTLIASQMIHRRWVITAKIERVGTETRDDSTSSRYFGRNRITPPETCGRGRYPFVSGSGQIFGPLRGTSFAVPAGRRFVSAHGVEVSERLYSSTKRSTDANAVSKGRRRSLSFGKGNRYEAGVEWLEAITQSTLLYEERGGMRGGNNGCWSAGQHPVGVRRV